MPGGKGRKAGLRSCMETIETYIIRVYRRNRNDPRKIAGLVETVGKNEKKAFSTREQLWDILEHEESRIIKKDLKKVHKHNEGRARP
jgi:hypothetical protein